MIQLFINYYNDPVEQRQEEFNQCLSRNIASKVIQKIILVTDRPDTNVFPFANSPKVEIISHHERPTYAYLFNLVNAKLNEPDFAIIANADIYFDDQDLFLIQNYMGHSTCFALSRWDMGPDGQYSLFDRCDSQDSWIFRGRLKSVPNCNFTMGKAGCDNAIAQRIEEAGYAIFNPSRSVRSFHHHQSNIRNYDAMDPLQVVSPPYKLVPPCRLEDLPIVNWVTEIAGLANNSAYSQYGEDAIIEHIFKHIGTATRYFVDLGAGAYGESMMSNTRRLKQNGWSGYGVDANSKGESWIIERFIKPDNILQIFKEQNTPKEFDFLNLDIDSCDFWVLQQVLSEYAPRCICTEFNGTLNPLISAVLKYQEGYTWDETNKYGYSFAAGEKLLGEHGYRIIHNMLDQNIFAVRKELVTGLIFHVTAREVPYHPLNTEAFWETY